VAGLKKGFVFNSRSPLLRLLEAIQTDVWDGASELVTQALREAAK
jgi:hypothetical protein